LIANASTDPSGFWLVQTIWQYVTVTGGGSSGVGVGNTSLSSDGVHAASMLTAATAESAASPATILRFSMSSSPRKCLRAKRFQQAHP
jgi:hypothetical protein